MDNKERNNALRHIQLKKSKKRDMFTLVTFDVFMLEKLSRKI